MKGYTSETIRNMRSAVTGHPVASCRSSEALLPSVFPVPSGQCFHLAIVSVIPYFTGFQVPRISMLCNKVYSSVSIISISLNHA